MRIPCWSGPMLSLVHVSSLPPTRCGVAEYTANLARQLASLPPSPSAPLISQSFVRLDQETTTAADDKTRVRGAGVLVVANPAQPESLIAAAHQVNRLGERVVVLLEHEFKLFGGTDGEHVRAFCGHLRGPIVTTLHTVWPFFPPARHAVFE